MNREATPIDPTPSSPPGASDQGYSLTHRAKLTFISKCLSQGASLVVGFIVTPIVIHGLGKELYGAWLMILQTVGYLAIGDMRPMGTLRYTLGVTQHIDDVAQKRRQIGAALLMWLLFCPFLLILGTAAVCAAPWYIHTDPSHVWMVRLAMSFTVVAVVLNRLIVLPASVLQGMNLEYKRMGLNAASTLLTGFCVVPAIWAGWSLPGLAGATLVGIVFVGIVQYWIAKKAIAWFGVNWPSRSEFRKFFSVSVWLFLSSLSFILLNATDIFVVGYVVSPSAAAVYGTTGRVLSFSIGPLINLLGSGMPGIVGLCGSQQWQRVNKLRGEMYVVSMGALTVIGCGILALNSAFLNLWVGPTFYGGNALNAALVLAAVAFIMIRVDSAILDGIMEFRRRALATLIAGLVATAGGVWLTMRLGPVGMAFAIIVGRIGLLVYQYIYVCWHLRQSLTWRFCPPGLVRSFVAGMGLMAVAAWLQRFLHPADWLTFAGEAVLVGAAASALVWILALDDAARCLLRNRLALGKRAV